MFSLVYPIHQSGHQILSTIRDGERRLDLDISIAYESNLDDAEAALFRLANDKRVRDTPPPRFLVVSYADSAIIVRLRVYANYADFLT